MGNIVEAFKNFKYVSILDPNEKGAKESLEVLSKELTEA
jgi:hypothetical protein